MLPSVQDVCTGAGCCSCLGALRKPWNCSVHTQLSSCSPFPVVFMASGSLTVCMCSSVFSQRKKGNPCTFLAFFLGLLPSLASKFQLPQLIRSPVSISSAQATMCRPGYPLPVHKVETWAIVHLTIFLLAKITVPHGLLSIV